VVFAGVTWCPHPAFGHPLPRRRERDLLADWRLFLRSFAKLMRTIALLTDFGVRDPYVASMKGVLASRTDARVADLTHDIEPFDVFGAGWFLSTVWQWWPAGTVFVSVVDPGVGTSRKIIAFERDGRTFLAPDNGLLTFVHDGGGAISVEDESHFLPGGSTTFHGRDRFAPVAAAIANGVSLELLGPRIDQLVRVAYEPPCYDCARVDGTIVAIDRFGNVITDIERSRIAFDRFALRCGERVIDRMSTTYADGGADAFLITGSSGHIEVSMANASAAEALQLRRGDCVTIIPK
jgi:S-adenosylmethionine hydrolase